MIGNAVGMRKDRCCMLAAFFGVSDKKINIYKDSAGRLCIINKLKR